MSLVLNLPVCTLEFLLALAELDVSVVDEELFLVQDQVVEMMCRHSSLDKTLMLEVAERLEYVGYTERRLMTVGDI